jgi:glutaredoxin
MKITLSIVLAVSLFSITASAQIYQWTDKDGKVRFSDSPPSGSNPKEVKSGSDRIFRSRSGSAPAVNDKSTQSQEPKRMRSFGDIDVIMYSTPWCGYCKKARQYVNSLGANLIEYNIEGDKSRKEEMLRKSGGRSSVPLIDIEGTIIRGYSPEAIKSVLEQKSSR